MVKSGVIVSESEAHSDSNSPIKENRVRIEGSFRQQWVNTRRIVSESEAHSDSNSLIKWNRVRIGGSFGQQ
jgi:hypothetical protein